MDPFAVNPKNITIVLILLAFDTQAWGDLREAIVHGAVKRVRPKMMTVTAAMLGLMPIMWSIGSGADVMKRIAAPMVGGLVSSFLLELLVYPPIYLLWRRAQLRRAWATSA